MSTFDATGCMASAERGQLEDWVHSYLNGGPWGNAGLATGLRQQRRYWTGPHLLPLGRLDRCCGPEAGMEYRVTAEAWQRTVSDMASRLENPMHLPPLIVEWRSGRLSIRDGNHRHAAMALAGWHACWVVIWCNSAPDYDAARGFLLREAPIA